MDRVSSTVKVKLELVRGPVEPNYHPDLPVLEAGRGHGLKPVEEGVGVVSWPGGLGGHGGHGGRRGCGGRGKYCAILQLHYECCMLERH